MQQTHFLSLVIMFEDVDVCPVLARMLGYMPVD